MRFFSIQQQHSCQPFVPPQFNWKTKPKDWIGSDFRCTFSTWSCSLLTREVHCLASPMSLLCSWLRSIFWVLIRVTSSSSWRIWSILRLRQFRAATYYEFKLASMTICFEITYTVIHFGAQFTPTLFFPLLRMSRQRVNWSSLSSCFDRRSLNSSMGKLMISWTVIGRRAPWKISSFSHNHRRSVA